MAQRVNGRDARIELMRLAACLGVIMIHIPNRITMMDAITCNAVMVFFAITGCFWFKTKRGYGRVALHFALTVLAPLLVMNTFAQIFNAWFDDPSWAIDASQLALPDIGRTLRGILKMDYTYWPQTGGHLWYVSDFTELLLFYVPMRLVATHPDRRIRWGVTLLCFCPVVILELSHVLPESVTAWLPGVRLIFPSYFVMMMLGQELYAERERYASKGWKCAFAGLVIFGGITLVRWLFSEKVPTTDGSAPYLTLISLFTFASLPAIFMIFMPMKLPEGLARPVRAVASLTYGIYLVHGVVIRKLTAVGWLDGLFQRCLGLTPKPYLDYFVYGALASLMIFAVCAVPVLPFRLLRAGLGRLIRAVPARNGGNA